MTVIIHHFLQILDSFPDFDIPNYDLDNNTRINDEYIDIGAYENQEEKLEFVTQPVGGTLCVGESITLSLSVTDTAYYQWQKDGEDISGATSSQYQIASLTDAAHLLQYT